MKLQKMPNNNSNNPLFEALSYKDMEGLMKPTIHVDEFSSKMGDDDDIIVVSFFVRDESAAKDLMNWFEKGYDFVLDADRSPGEIKPNRYLVYVEIRRRSTAGANVEILLRDLNTLTEYNLDDWTMHYRGEEVPALPRAGALADRRRAGAAGGGAGAGQHAVEEAAVRKKYSANSVQYSVCKPSALNRTRPLNTEH